jgi:large subunit ribosomal protein L24
MKLKTGDSVVVLAGKYKGATGEITAVYPKANKVLIAGVNIAKKHQKPTNKDQKGGIIDKDVPLDASNVALLHKGKPTRVGYKEKADGTKVRVAKKTGDEI